MEQLPAELLLEIFSNLPPESLSAVCATSRFLRNLAQDDRLWKAFFVAPSNSSSLMSSFWPRWEQLEQQEAVRRSVQELISSRPKPKTFVQKGQVSPKQIFTELHHHTVGNATIRLLSSLAFHLSFN